MNLIDELTKYFSSHLPRLEEMRSYYQGLTLESAIKNAAAGIESEEKMSSHQYRIGKKKGVIAANEMLKYKRTLSACRTFEDIFKITEQVKNSIVRLGDLWSYDTALRIGFKLDILPAEVYVQSGVVDGVKKALNGKRPKGRSIPLSIFPEKFQQLTPYQAENFLCIWGKEKSNSNC